MQSNNQFLPRIWQIISLNPFWRDYFAEGDYCGTIRAQWSAAQSYVVHSRRNIKADTVYHWSHRSFGHFVDRRSKHRRNIYIKASQRALQWFKVITEVPCECYIRFPSVTSQLSIRFTDVRFRIDVSIASAIPARREVRSSILWIIIALVRKYLR